MRLLYELSVWLHILAAAVWIGGMSFIALVLVPVIRRPEFHGSAAALIERTGRQFRGVGWLCLGLLVLTGVFNVAVRGGGGVGAPSPSLWTGPFGRTLGLKLLLAAAILALSAAHDFVIGPRAMERWRRSPESAEAIRLRRQAAWIGRLNLLLALIAVGLGVMLVRGIPW